MSDTDPLTSALLKEVQGLRALVAQLTRLAAPPPGVALDIQISSLRRDSDRLKWLHTGGGGGARKEWGVCECEFDGHGRLLGAFWGRSDSSDIDAAMIAEFADEDPALRMNQAELCGLESERKTGA